MQVNVIVVEKLLGSGETVIFVVVVVLFQTGVAAKTIPLKFEKYN
jgi:hypothetical protein